MTRVAIFTSSLSGGGMERAMLNLAEFYSSQGALVDFIVASGKGPLLEEAKNKTNLIDLRDRREKNVAYYFWYIKAFFVVEPLIALFLCGNVPKSIKVIPGIIQYLNESNPHVVISTPTSTNLAVLWSAYYCGFKNKIIVREATTLSLEIKRNLSFFISY